MLVGDTNAPAQATEMQGAPPGEVIMESGTETFQQDVLDVSQSVPVIVDFWAPWCGPCKTLGPVLEEVVSELGPGIALAKINVDDNQQLAAAFKVQGIPAVKIVKDGQLAQEFTGALPKDQIDAILRPLVGDAPVPEAEAAAYQAEDLAASGDLAGAARQYEKVLEDTPNDGAALLGLAKLHLMQGNAETVQELVNLIEQVAPEYQQAQALLSQIEFAQKCHQAGGRAACAQQMLAEPADQEVRYNFACCAAIENDYETALHEWFQIIEKKPGHETAKEAMVAIFHLLGREDELVTSYQRRLYQALH